jgi:DNA-binding NarL/FixJ family response regulator
MWDAAAISPALLLRTVPNGTPALALISADLSTIPSHGYGLASALSRSHPEMRIVLLLAEASRDAVSRAFQAGAIGVFCQEEPMSELLHCIEHVSNGLVWAGKKATLTLIETFRNIPSSDALTGVETGSLTPRELQVIQYAATGKTNRLIAAQLRLSEHTVKNYMFRAFSKLGVSSRVELLFYLALRGQSVASPEVGYSAERGGAD